MGQLPPQALPTVHHIAFWIFDLAIPSIIAGLAVVAVLLIAPWARFPKISEPKLQILVE